MSLPARRTEAVLRPTEGDRPFSVSEVLGQVQHCLGRHFRPVLVRGEVADPRRPRGGNLYLTLRDATSSLKVVVYEHLVGALPGPVQAGDEVVAWGRITAYPRAGEVQLVADGLSAVGAGALRARRERLRARLEAEGLFRPDAKVALPFLPRVVGVVTSPTGAALRDVLTTFSRRFPSGVRVLLAPVRVNGLDAAPDVAHAVRALDARGGADVILVVRGGGSAEDLAAFDAEAVVRAIAACRTPVVTGIGHETDVTLADLAADRRAPTPTAAAELAVPVEAELRRGLDLHGERLAAAIEARLRSTKRRLELAARAHGLRAPHVLVAAFRARADALEKRLARVAPAARLARWRERLAEAEARLRRAAPDAAAARAGLAAAADRLDRAAARRAALARAALDERAARLAALSPLAVLGRGYSLTTRPGPGPAAIVHDAAELEPGDVVHTRLARGELTARVISVQPGVEGGAPSP